MVRVWVLNVASEKVSLISKIAFHSFVLDGTPTSVLDMLSENNLTILPIDDPVQKVLLDGYRSYLNNYY